MPTDYKHSLSQLLSLADFERKARASDRPDFHLRRTAHMLERLGDPHRAVPVIHVAGTKGKGSTAAMIASALTACGYRVGLFTSPHLHRMTERIRIDMRPIGEEQFAQLLDRLWPIAHAAVAGDDLGGASVFELLTVMAFQHFVDARADVAVIEVGLGGRLDSTNVVRPEVSVITPISLDHVAILGNTIPLVAVEKAGIIKPSTPVVASIQPPEAMRVIEQRAEELRAPLTDASSVLVLEQSYDGPSPQKVRLEGERGEYSVRLPLLGEHQIENLRTAIAAIEAFAARGFNAPADCVERGLSGVSWPARVQLLISGNQRILADGAHNAESALALRRAIARHFPDDREPVLVLGASGGHDALAVVEVLRDLGPIVLVTQSRHPKSVPASDFAAALEDVKIAVHALCDSTAQALVTARSLARGRRLIIATGSLFIAAEAIEAVEDIEPEIYPDLRGAAGPARLAVPKRNLALP